MCSDPNQVQINHVELKLPDKDRAMQVLVVCKSLNASAYRPAKRSGVSVIICLQARHNI